MSDTYSGIKDWGLDRDAAVRKTIGYIESSPDDAARALELSESTGVSAPAIAGDLEGFERQTKSRMAGQVVQNNNYIADYINSHPMAAQLSNDDYGNLDTVSEALNPLGGDGSLKKIVDAFNAGAGEGAIGTWAFDPKIDYTNPLNRLSWAAWSLLGAPIEIPFRTFSGLLHSGAAAIGESYKALGGNEAWANRLTRDVLQAAQANMTGNSLMRAPIAHEFQQIAKQAAQSIKTVEPYVKSGHEPPIGVDKLWDEAKIESSKADVDALMDSIKESQSSLTKERNPDMYAGFVRQHVGDQSIGIHADAIRGLYGDKPSAWDDAMLGFVPKLDEKLITAEATGGYVDIPMAEYIAKVEPEVAKALEDFTRVRAGGVSKGEAKDIKASVEVPDALPPERAVETVRDAAALVPKERKLELRRVQDEAALTVQQGLRKFEDEAGASHTFELVAPDGVKGELYVTEEKGGKRLYVDDIVGVPNTIGPRALRDLLEQLKIEFPNAEELVGQRVSGARDKAGSWETKGKVSIKLAEPTASDHLFQILLDDRIERLGEQSELGEGFTATTIPEARWQNFERSIVEKVDAEIEKLGLGDVDVEAVHKLESAKGEMVRGLYQSYENARPSILFALTADDPVGVLRHEVMHDLRTRGFLSEQEWSILEKAAKDEGWLEKHQVSDRYKDLEGNTEALTEEAIADQFADWRRNGKPADTIYAKVFQKIDQLIEAIRSAMRQLFGTENWKDIFDKIESGEVAKREPTTEFGDVTKEATREEKEALRNYVIDGPSGADKAVSDLVNRSRFDEPQTLYRAGNPDDLNNLKDNGFISATHDRSVAESMIVDDPSKVIYTIHVEKGAPGFHVEDYISHYDDEAEVLIGRGAIRPGTEPNSFIIGPVVKESRGPSQPELPGTRRMEDRDVFAEAQAAGMTVDQYKRYMKLIAERHREDLRKESERALKDAKRRQTEEWKTNYAELRPQVMEEINERPDIATDNLLREQRLFGRKTDPIKINSEFLTPEQRKALPNDYVAKDGAHPDDIAALTGYASGQDLVLGLVGLEMKRKESGLRPIEYNRRLIAAETERQMEQKFGRLADNILDEAKEQVLSETQLDLLHEEVLAAGLKAGAEFPITKQQMKDWVAERFAGENAKDISSDKFLADAGRAGRMAEDALLKGDPAEAFRQKQRQYLAVAMTRLAKDFEKAQTQFDTLAERMIRKEPKGYDKDFVNFTQGMLARSGYNIKRNLNELADSISRSGFTSFDEFVQSKIGDGWELSVAEELRQGSGKPIEKMTTAEFMDLKESLDSLAYVGREIGKIDIAGQKLDFAEWKEGVLENIRSLPVRDKNKPVKQRLRFDASMTRMEEIAKDLDLREELGPLWNALIRPMAESKHTEYSMLEDLSKKLREMKGDRKWQRSLQDTITQDFFHDPYDATLFDLTRQDMVQIMLNFGNRSNIEKFTRGYVGKEEAPGFEAKLWDLIHKNANKEDWEFVQKVWDIFDGWKQQSGKLYYDLSGRQPKWIDPSPITTPHGEFAGGYYPIIYDRLRSNINAIEEKVSPNALFGSNYFRASPANHYAKERTGYADRVQFQTSIEQVAGRMQQLIHDVSYRRAVMDASKVVYDREIRGAIRKHYGMEYEKQLDPWLKDIANHFNNDEVANDFASAVMRRARANLVGHALGLNLKVILSPAVAKMNPADAMRVWGDYKASETLAYEKSFEIPHTFRNIDRDFRERLEASIAKGGWNEYQATAVRWAFMPVVKIEQQFRVITFVNEYQKALAKGMSEGDASVLADSYVRERHGSTGLPDMPAIMRGSEGMKIATMFYGYFSAMYNWQRQIPGNIRRGEWKDGLANIWGAVVIPSLFGAVLFNQSKEGDSWGKQMAKAVPLQMLSTLVFVRDFANFFIEGNPSRTPLATAAAAVASIISDTKNYHEGKKIKKPIQHIGNVIGLSTGLPMAQLSRTTQFAADVHTGQQRPRNISEWARGIITGEARLKK